MAKTVYTNEDIDKLEADESINGNTTKRTTWYSIPSELLNDINFCQKINEVSAHYFTFHCYLKTQMLANEKYYIFEKNIRTVITLYSTLFHVDIKEVQRIYNDLMDCGYIRTLNPSCFDGQPIVVDDTVVDNYYQAQKKRAMERTKAQNKATRKSAKNIKSGIQSAPAVEATTTEDTEIDDMSGPTVNASIENDKGKVQKAAAIELEVPTQPVTDIFEEFPFVENADEGFSFSADDDNVFDW